MPSLQAAALKAEKLLSKEMVRLTALTSSARPGLARYRDDPLGYVRDVLRCTPTAQQEAALTLLMLRRKVLCSSGHSVGKSFVGAALVSWWFDCRGGICLTTAPTQRQVIDILWHEVRALRARAGLGGFPGLKAPRLEAADGRWAHGFTARDATRFQGHHHAGGVLVVFDEADGVEPPFWQALKTMLDDHSYFLGLYNPVGQMTGAHVAEQQADEHGSYARVTLSCLDHPNIAAGLAGLPLPVPGAITPGQLREMLLEDSTLLGPHDPAEPGDVALAGERFRPGPISEARALGRRPSVSTVTLWGELLWRRALTQRPVDPAWGVAIGCDVARYGDDLTCFVVRKGYAVLHAETHAKLSNLQVNRRLKELCHQFRDAASPDPRRIPCLIDEGGLGSGVLDYPEGHTFVAVNASCRPAEPHKYERVRDEVWFGGRDAANQGCMDLSRLPAATLHRLKAELLAVRYAIVPGKDTRKVEAKDDLKARLGRSPDLADALNLAYYHAPLMAGRR